MFTAQKILDTDFYLRCLCPDDAGPDYLEWLNNPVTNRFLEVRFHPPKTLSDLISFIQHCNESSKRLLLGIFVKKDDLHIGNIKLDSINDYHQTADLGFLIGRTEYWGRGYASKAIFLASEFGFSQLGLGKITAGAVSANIGSQKALLRAGFVQEGLLRSQAVMDNCRQDVLVFGKVKTVSSFSKE